MQFAGYDTSFLNFPPEQRTPTPPPASGGGFSGRDILPFVGPWAPLTAGLGIGKQVGRLFG